MVALDEPKHSDTQDSEEKFECTIAGKKEKEVIFRSNLAHDRGIVAVYPVRAPENKNGLVTISHDSLKVWSIEESDEGVVSFTERKMYKRWRCGVQSSDVTPDGRRMAVLGLDSILYEICPLDPHMAEVEARDLGYMEAWHIRIAPPSALNYMTTSFSGHLSEVDLRGQFLRQHPFNNVKHISVIAYDMIYSAHIDGANGHKGDLLAVANTEGVVHVIQVSTMQTVATIEIHAMKIRCLCFTMDDTMILSGADDKTIKLHEINRVAPVPTNSGPKRIFCGNKASVTCIALDSRTGGQRFASSNMIGQVMLWNIELPTVTHILPSVNEIKVSSVAFTSSGRHLIAVSDDRMITAYVIPQEAGAVSPGWEHDDLMDQALSLEDQDLENKDPVYESRQEDDMDVTDA